MAKAKEDTISFAVALDVPDRLDVFAVDGRLLFGRMGRATSGSHGPGGWYLNRFYELAGGKIQPAKALQKGLWEDFYISRIEGHWPEAVSLVGTNYANTAWEEVTFVWDEKAKAWDTHQDRARAWPGGRIVAKLPFASQRDVEIFKPVPSGAALGVPENLFADLASGSQSLTLAPPRDLFALEDPCANPDGRNCDATAVLHWCAPRKSFERAALPDILVNGAIVAVPGTAYAYDEDDGYLVRDGVVTKIAPPDKSPRGHRFKTSGGAIFYLGEKGLFRLEEDGFRRLFAWTRTGDREKLTLPGANKPVVITGFHSRGPTDFLMTTWDEKRSQVWSTTGEKLAL